MNPSKKIIIDVNKLASIYQAVHALHLTGDDIYTGSNVLNFVKNLIETAPEYHEPEPEQEVTE